MKKGLLLSVAASAVIFAGGDIAPVEPAAPAADFWGQVGFFYQAQDVDWDPNPFVAPAVAAARNAVFDMSFSDETNNNFAVTAVLGVEKEIGMGFGVGLELAGWSGLGWDLGDAMLFKADPVLAGVMNNGGEVSQAYLTYTFGNTAIKVGRQALPKAVSPWAYSSRTGGVIDVSYDGIVIANTDLQDTTLVFAWVDQAYTAPNMPQVEEVVGTVYAGEQYDLSNVDVSDGAGLFMLGLINKSLANTTLSLAAYYIPESKLNGLVGNVIAADLALPNRTSYADTWSIWASAVGSVNSINWGLQFAYVDGDADTVVAATGATIANTGWDATYGVAGKIGSSWGDFDAELVVGYINDGDYSLRTAGYAGGSPSAFWTFNGDFGGDTVGQDQWAIIAKAGYKLGNGKLYGNVGYWEFDENVDNVVGGTNEPWDNAFDVRIGYKFKIMDIDAQVEYRYLDVEREASAAHPLLRNDDFTRQRIRVEAYYKF